MSNRLAAVDRHRGRNGRGRETGEHHGDHRHLHPAGDSFSGSVNTLNIDAKATIKPAEKASDKARQPCGA
jgi:hypothetical protein